jgi:hypothetical protein
MRCRDFGRRWRVFGAYAGSPRFFGPPGFAFRFGWPPRVRYWGGPSRQEMIRWLEEYQRDLEQEILDVAARIKDLREDKVA